MSVDRVLRELEEIDRVLDRAPFELYYNVATAGIKYGGKVYDYAVYLARDIDADTFKEEVSFAFKCVRGVRRRLVYSKGIRNVCLDAVNYVLHVEFTSGKDVVITSTPKIVLLGQNFIAIIPKTLLFIITPESIGVYCKGYWFVEETTNLIYHEWLSRKLLSILRRSVRVGPNESPLAPLITDVDSRPVIDLDS